MAFDVVFLQAPTVSLSNIDLRRATEDRGTPTSEIATARLTSLPPASPIRQPMFDDAITSPAVQASRPKPRRPSSTKADDEQRLPTIPSSAVVPRPAGPERRTVAVKAVSVKWSSEAGPNPSS